MSSSLQSTVDELSLSLSQLENLVNSFIGELNNANGSMAMLQSCVRAVPTGKESGVFYGIDLGGTNLRILRKNLPNGELRQLKRRIPDAGRSGSASDLFGFIATAVRDLAKECNDTERLKIGFTFSFPMKKRALNSAFLQKWTKGFKTTGCVGNDVGQLLQTELDKLGVDAQVVAIINDTVGTQLAGGLGRSGCYVGVILGTGSNAAYFRNGEIINTEWGNFNVKLPRTKADITIDNGSVYPGSQQYEKMISGLYLGDIGRLSLQEVFDFTVPKIESRDLSVPIFDRTSDLVNLDLWLKSKHGLKLDLNQRRAWKRVCQSVVYRSADLATIGIAGLIRDMKLSSEERIVVAVDGAVFGKPTYATRMKWTLNRLGISNAEIIAVEDGSGVGAILAAAVAAKGAVSKAKL